jgi:DNA/RNA endonuclease G (NUC1)
LKSFAVKFRWCQWPPALLGVLALLFSSFQAEATIDVTLQMQLGNPSGATSDTNNHDHYLIQRTVEAIDYSDNLGEPNWASWDLTAGDIGSSGRSPDFYTDTTLPTDFYWVTPTDYNGVGNISFDRGHMCPSNDRTDNVTDNDLVFYMSNIIPQASNNNEGVWANFETYCRSLAQAGNELLIICGPSGFGVNRIPSGKAVIPDYTWKIAVVVPLGSGTALSRITNSTRVVAIKIPNNNSVSSTWQNYITSGSVIENDTGFTFFTALPANVASALRSEVDGQTNPPPVINSFVPLSGAVGDSITITGTNFTSAAAVAFNGVSAAFILNSSTQITTTVPTNATSGTITVTAPAGTGISSTSFIVAGAPADLVITKSHIGNFTQGDAADTYIISIANVGSLPSSGTITVTDALPAGLTATDISGAGWTTDLNSLTCTRTDALPAGASYPYITVTVAVATNAPANITNTASVTGGVETNLSNNTASDVTTVLPATSNGSVTTLFGWDVSGLTGGASNFGASPMPATTIVPNLTVAGLTRGSGVSITGTAAMRAWGGVGFIAASEAAAITANQFVSFGGAVNNGYTVSFNSISTFNYRRSSTGPASGVLQYQVGSGTFIDIVPLSYPTNTSSGASLNPINLSGISALQNVGAGTNVTFRIINYGGGSAGTWYIFDVSKSTDLDLAIQGSIQSVAVNPPAIAPSFSSLIVSNSQFQFTVTGTAESNYVVQASDNLATPNWIPVMTNAAPFLFMEPISLPQKFYRAVVAQ